MAFAIGAMLFANQNEKTPIRKQNTARGIIRRLNGIPADFIATISYLSPKFPKVISEASRTAKGIAIETNEAEA